MSEADLSVKRGCAGDAAQGLRGLRRTFILNERATRTELAVSCLLAFAAAWSVTSVIDWLVPTASDRMLDFAKYTAALLPLPAATARRFHDIGKSGWLSVPMALGCALYLWRRWGHLDAPPYEAFRLIRGNELAEWGIAIIALFYCVILMRAPQVGDNRYGPDPRAAPKQI